MAGMHPVDPTDEMVNGDFREVSQTPAVTEETVVGDLRAIANSDMLVLFAHQSSTGAGQEALFAAMLGKRVVVVTGFSAYSVSETAISPWALFVADLVCDELTVAVLNELEAGATGPSMLHRRIHIDLDIDLLTANELATTKPLLDAWRDYLGHGVSDEL